MKIVDKSEEFKKEHLEKERFRNIEILIKNHFSSCVIGNLFLNSIDIHSPSERIGKVASFSAFMYSPGKMELYLKEYEKNALDFGKEYEERGLHNSFKGKPSANPEEQQFILEKHYF
jgi:hypothetical protein